MRMMSLIFEYDYSSSKFIGSLLKRYITAQETGHIPVSDKSIYEVPDVGEEYNYVWHF